MIRVNNQNKTIRRTLGNPQNKTIRRGTWESLCLNSFITSVSSPYRGCRSLSTSSSSCHSSETKQRILKIKGRKKTLHCGLHNPQHIFKIKICCGLGNPQRLLSPTKNQHHRCPLPSHPKSFTPMKLNIQYTLPLL